MCRSGVEVVVNDGAIGRIVRGRFLRRYRSGHEVIIIDADGRGWPVEICAARFHGIMRLSQWRDVIENPKRTPVGGDDQVVSVNVQIVDRNGRKIQLQRLPVVAVVE